MNKTLFLAGSVRALTRNKLRTFFMSLGIVVGVAALVVTRSMGSGAEQDMLNKMDRIFRAGSIVIVNSGHFTRGGIREPGKLTVADIEAIETRLEQVIDSNPSVIVSGREVQYRERNQSLMIVGDSERAASVSGRGVSEGESISKADVSGISRVALIGSKAASALFGDEDPVGKQIRIGGSPFRVKGILEEHGVDPHGLDRDNEIHVPITTLMRRILNTDRIGSAQLIVSSPEKIDDTVDQVAEILFERHGLADDEPDDFSIFTSTLVRERVREANRVLTIYLPATAGIALLVAAIVIANIMLIGVRERVPEIGLRKAVGATNRQISLQFLLESLAVTSISGALGVAVGVGALASVARTVGPETRITPDSVFLGLAAALVVGVLAGFLPARQAARQEPVDALQ